MRAASLLLAQVAAAVLAEPRGPIPVEFQTADGVTIHGWYIHAGDHEVDRSQLAQVPAVVLLHMNRGRKEDWEPLFLALRERGIASLAVDMRGHGESTKGAKGEDLARRVAERDPELYRSMWQDAAAAVRWLEEFGHKAERIGLAGASVGCSVAIDAARRDSRLQVVAALTPGENYLGVPTMEHLKDWGERALLVVTSEEEAPKGPKAIYELLSRREEARVELWTLKEKEIHGTRMFGRVSGIEDRLAAWFAEELRRPQGQ